MTDTSVAQQILGGVALLVTGVNGWLIYRSSDRASRRTAETQQRADAAVGFQQLTQEQRTELTELRARVRESEESARRSRDAAEAAEEIAEKCHYQQERLIEGYRQLWEWANRPCPHEGPPPPPPIRIWA